MFILFFGVTKFPALRREREREKKLLNQGRKRTWKIKSERVRKQIYNITKFKILKSNSVIFHLYKKSASSNKKIKLFRKIGGGKKYILFNYSLRFILTRKANI